MNVESIVQTAGSALGAASGHEAAIPYLLAFLSSAAVEVIAVAVVLAMLMLGAARSILGSNTMTATWLRLYRALDVLKLYKMVIPLACLSATVWIWTLIQGA